MTMLLALLIYGLSILLLYTLAMTGRYGKRLRTKARSEPFHRPLDLLLHKRWVKRSFLVVIASILVIEPTVRFLGLPYSKLFYIHFPLFVSFALLFFFAYKFDGTKNDRSSKHPRRHNDLARLALLFGLLTVVTGDAIVEMLIWPRL
jgi:hypothetical protein